MSATSEVKSMGLKATLPRLNVLGIFRAGARRIAKGRDVVLQGHALALHGNSVRSDCERRRS